MGLIVQTTGLCKNFGRVVAVDRVDLEIEAGTIFGLLGPNGSGKSTIIRMLCGLLRPSSGSAVVDGINVVARPDAIKARIGYMSQRFSLYRDLTVNENLKFYGHIYGLFGQRFQSRRGEIIDLTGIGDYTDRLAGDLSGGWQQRLALGCALLHEPRMVFLDEPTAGIDPVARRQLWDLLFQLSGRGTTFLVTTHYMDEAERCSRVGYLYLSRLITCGNPQELLANPAVHPPGTRWIAVESNHSTQAYVLLKDSPGVLRATIFGRTPHLLIESGRPAEEFATRISSAGLHAGALSEVQPSLEDLFVALTEQHASRRTE